ITIGPEPISRIFLRSLFRGICASADSKRNHAKVTREDAHRRSTILVDSAAGLLARRFVQATIDKLEAYLPSSAGSRTSTPLRHLRHALPIEVNLADAFDPREDVINCLAADAHQFRAHDAGHEIARKLENFLWSRAFEAFAKERGHRTGKRLHF